MAALVQGVQYGLSSQGSFDENKSVVFVKLTDSAFRAIDDYLKNKGRINSTPKIQFLGNEGQLSFPSSNDTSHCFKFNLTNNADIEGPQGSFECIQQTGSKNLESLGALHCKMRIQAKDDVYEATRHRMAVAEEAQKKNRTREIKPGGPGIGKKVKLPPGPRRVHEIAASATPSETVTSSPALRPSYSNKPVANGYHGMQNGMLNGNSKAILNNHRHPGNPDVMKRPLRERLIHLLAVRNYKKPEILDRMHRDGLREKDRKLLPDVLKQVSLLRDNSYQLVRHLWNDVQENWPFYSEQERQMLKRRKPQNLTPPGGSDGGSSSGSGQSPTSTHPGSPPSATVKRPGYVDGVDGLPTKKPRISHYRRPPIAPAPAEPSPPAPSVLQVTTESSVNTNARWNSASNPTSRSSCRASPIPRITVEEERPRIVVEEERPRIVVEEERPRRPPPVEPLIPVPPVPVQEVVREENSSESIADSQPEYPEYLSCYTTILNSEQRTRYKEDFNADYSEYRDLHAIVETVSRHFAVLEERLRQEEVNSPGWKIIKQQIMAEYQKNKCNLQHQEAKRRFQYLHEKLSHIKRLVLEYDSALSGQHY